MDQDKVIFLELSRDTLGDRRVVDAFIHHCYMIAAAAGGPRHGVVFAGYDDDPRKLWEIPECISVCKRILMEVPHFIKVVDQATLLVIMFSTAVKVDDKWKVNPYWETVVTNCKDIILKRD